MLVVFPEALVDILELFPLGVSRANAEVSQSLTVEICHAELFKLLHLPGYDRVVPKITLVDRDKHLHAHQFEVA